MKKELDVVAALIKKEDKFLICQRNAHDHYANLWEFPGGTVEDKEDLPRAIEREIKEELDLEIEAKDLLTELFDEDQNLIIKVFLFACVIKRGVPKTVDCQAFGFFTISEAERLNLAPADRKILDYLKSSYR
jgi:8-oxo-dGTP diphosphatase